MIKQYFEIQEIPNKLAQEIVVKNHYLHRKAPCSFAYGLFCEENIVGVIMYGSPSSRPLCRGICGEEEALNVLELTRLWVEDSCPKNCESFLISNTLKLVPKEIVVSFADTKHGHLGVVYQASNFLYTGLSAKRSDWVVEGLPLHGKTLADKYTSKEIREKFGEKFSLKERPRKHRYIFIKGKSKKRQKELMEKLRYEIQEYPKGAKR